jgi:diguanylate cyclase (GGDEF)-like protein/PAS domain S-box-containing protein
MIALHIALIISPYLISAGLSIWVALIAWQRRSVMGSRAFIALALFEAEWTLGYLLQRVSPGLETKIFWNNIQFIGAIGAPLMYFAFSLEYGRRELEPSHPSWKLLIPLATLLLLFIWTDKFHGLFRGHSYLVAAQPFPLLTYDSTPGFGLFTVYAYSLIILTTLILVARYLSASRLYRLQIGIVLVGVLVPWLTSVITALNLVPIKLHEITPITFGFCNLIIAWALFRYHLFEIIPIARDAVVEKMRDGVIVLDNVYRVIDLNHAALEILHTNAPQVLGRKIHERLQVEPEWLESLCDGNENKAEIVLKNGKGPAYYEVLTSCLTPQGSTIPAYLINLRDITSRKKIEEKLHMLAITDSLTGIFNRRHSLALAQQEISRAIRLEQDLAILLIDVDHFKRINDTYGHQVGDQVLLSLADCCRLNLRSFDIFGRYGGEEFIALLPGANAACVNDAAERLRATVANLSVPTEKGSASVTISLGIANLSDFPNATLDELLNQADQALYRAKTAGRNRASA